MSKGDGTYWGTISEDLQTKKIYVWGIICVKGAEYQVKIQAKTEPLWQLLQLDCEKELQSLIQKSLPLLEKRIIQCKNVQSILDEIRDIVETSFSFSSTSQTSSNLPAPSFYVRIMSELNVIGWDRIEGTDSSFTKFQLTTTDKNGRKHLLGVELGPQYPSQSPKFQADLPVAFEPNWYPASSSLNEILLQFEKVLEQYQELWNILQEFDSRVWVVEPERFSYSNCFRRIALGNHSWLQLKLDWMRPKSLPLDLQFIGSEAAVQPLKELYNKNIHLWPSLHSSSTFSLTNHLQSILNVTFPSPATTSKQDYQVECAICYSYRLLLDDSNPLDMTSASLSSASSFPDRVCDNQKCNKYFHKHCLYEWLRSIPSTKQSFDTLYGDCPNCSSLISVKIKL